MPSQRYSCHNFFLSRFFFQHICSVHFRGLYAGVFFHTWQNRISDQQEDRRKRHRCRNVSTMHASLFWSRKLLQAMPAIINSFYLLRKNEVLFHIRIEVFCDRRLLLLLLLVGGGGGGALNSLNSADRTYGGPKRRLKTWPVWVRTFSDL